METSTDFEKNVLDEYIAEIKSTSPFVSVSDCENRMQFDRIHGEFASHKLLQINTGYILDHGNFDKEETVRFWKLVRMKYGVVKKIKDVGELDWDRVVEDGVGQVMMDDGTTYIIDPS